MKNLLYILFLLFNALSFGQIHDPAETFDIERSYQNTEKPGDKWDFSKKPFKQITKRGGGNPTIDKFDSIGRHIERNVLWNSFTVSTITKYKGDIMVEFTRKTIYDFDENGNKIRPDEISTTKLNLDNKGNIIDGASYKLDKDSTFVVNGLRYYDKKNRLIKSVNVTGTSADNFYYSGNNLIRKEEIRPFGTNSKTILERNYKYNKDNQIIHYQSIIKTFVNDKLTEEKIGKTVHQEFKNKLLVKKTLIDDVETIERNYTYDKDKNLTTFIEVKKNNSDGMITSQMKRTKKYENKLLAYSEVQEGLSTQQGKFSFTYYFHSDDESLVRQATTDNKGNIQTEYIYNEYGHLIKTITTFSDTPNSKSEVIYEIEYY